MPTAVDKLTKDSSDAQVKAAISDCIATELKVGRERDQAVAMCYAMARKQTGRELAPRRKAGE